MSGHVSQADLATAATYFKAASAALVVAHASPDGDAVGSTLAMTLLLEELGVAATPYNCDSIPYNLSFLPGSDRWTTRLDGSDGFDLVVILDCAEASRVGDTFEAIDWGCPIVVVDHHKTWDPDFADFYLRSVQAAATGQLIYELATHLGVMTQEIAENLYCCLMCDTGSFRYSNTSKTTFAAAGELVAQGVDPWRVSSNVYESQPVERIETLARVLSTLEVSDDGKLAFLIIEQSVLPDGAGPALVDGFINYARSVRGVEVATQMTEVDAETYKISFRSRGAVDVSRLAERFGGGGHHNAAGCIMSGPHTEIQRQLAQALTELLE